MNFLFDANIIIAIVRSESIGLLTFLVFIILFTAVFGRVFCGWVYPQTIFLEMVFRKIENWIEVDFKAKKRLDVST